MVTPTDFLCDVAYRFTWDATYNTTCLTDVPTYIYLIRKIDSLLTKQGALASQVTEELKLELDDQKIRGGYNTMRLMDFFMECMDVVNKLISLLYNKVWGRGVIVELTLLSSYRLGHNPTRS